MSVRAFGSAYPDRKHIAKLQALATLAQAAAVQNTWYTVCNLTGDLEIDELIAEMDTAAETIECRLTIDGINPTTASQAALADTMYHVIIQLELNNSFYSYFTTDRVPPQTNQQSIKCRAFKMEIRKTTALGANTLRGTVLYHRW